jgi:hypothetical protein
VQVKSTNSLKGSRDDSTLRNTQATRITFASNGGEKDPTVTVLDEDMRDVPVMMTLDHVHCD